MDSGRLSQLEDFRSTVTAKQMRALHSKFDIPKEFKLTAPAKSAAVYRHGEGKAPLYISHLECGLRLPLHPFLRKVFWALGVSPMQMTPNSIAMLVGFTVICSWLGIVPSVDVLSHLLSVMVQKAAHYHLQTTGDFKIVMDLPTSHKGWKEKFVWVEGDDSNLDCSNWPEIRKEALDPKPLSLAERQELEQIVSYTGPRMMGALLNKSVLRLHGISSVPPTKRDDAKANNLTFGGPIGLGTAAEPTPSGGSSEESPGESASTPAKRLREETVDKGVSSPLKRREVTKDVATGVAPRPAQRWQKKTSHGPRGARRLGEKPDAPMEVESADYEDELPPEPSETKPGVTPGPEPGRAETQPSAGVSARDEGRSHRPGKEPAGGSSGLQASGVALPLLLGRFGVGSVAYGE